MSVETVALGSDYDDHVLMTHEGALDILISDEAASTAALRGIVVAYPRRRFVQLAGHRLTAEEVELN